MINIDWGRLTQTYEDLKPRLPEDIFFHYRVRGAESLVTKRIPAEKFLKFVWRMYDDERLEVENFVVSDEEGAILYRHTPVNKSGERLPIKGNPYIVKVWNALDEDSKSMWMKLLMTEMEYETTHESKFGETRELEAVDSETEG